MAQNVGPGASTGYWAGLISIGTDKEVATEAPGTMGLLARGEQGRGWQVSGLEQPALQARTTGQLEEIRGGKAQGRAGGLLEEEEGLLATVRTRWKRPVQHPGE